MRLKKKGISLNIQQHKLLAIALVLTMLGGLFYPLSNTPLFSNLDNTIFSKTNDFQNDTNIETQLIKDVSNVGDTYYIIILLNLGLATLLYIHKEYSHIFTLAISNLSVIYANIIKLIIRNERPLGISSIDQGKIFHLDYSYPSAHTVFYVVFFGFLYYLAATTQLKETLTYKTLRWFSAYMVLFVGVSRIILQKHWTTDVIGGYFFGIAFLLALIVLDQWLAQRLVKQQAMSLPQLLKRIQQKGL